MIAEPPSNTPSSLSSGLPEAERGQTTGGEPPAGEPVDDLYLRPVLVAMRRFATVLSCVALIVLAIAVFGGVVMRYGMQIGDPMLDDLVRYAFGMLVGFSVAAAFLANRHVVVCIMSRTGRPSTVMHRPMGIRWVLALIFPLLVLIGFGVILMFAFPEVVRSWRILEGSGQIGGLPGYFLVKSVLILLSMMMVIRGLASLIQAIVSPGRR